MSEVRGGTGPVRLDDLVQELTLEPLEANLFRGKSQDLGWGTVFGGQVLCQALSAASATVPTERAVHSLHAYFLRPGKVDKPIIYDVEPIRDGSSFTTRRVVAIQNGHPIFNLAASFQVSEPGFEHQSAMPEAPDPLSVPTEQDCFKAMGDRLPASLRWRATCERPFELRPVGGVEDLLAPAPKEPRRMVWMRGLGTLPDNPALHASLLAYVSDFAFITTSLLPHGVTGWTPGMQVASLDHVMWFHHPLRVDRWLLYVMDSPAAQGARGLVRGSIYTQEGKLVASTAQEGLVRLRKLSD
jgi:acyl-CoA thioesterase-2